MLTIRFSRVGRKNNPQYRIVVQEHTIAPTGRHVEIIGSYNPHSKEAVLKDDRVKYWIEKGAQASDSAYNLFVAKGVIDEKKKVVKIGKKRKEGEDAGEKASAEKGEAGKQEEEKKEVQSSGKDEGEKSDAVKTGSEPEDKKPQEASKEEKKGDQSVEKGADKKEAK